MSLLPTLAWIAEAILTVPQLRPLRLVAVDGRAGSGKSTFARNLSQALGGAPILPIDDFLAWDDLTEFWPRLEAQALNPLFEGRKARYRARDWEHDPYGRGLGSWMELPFSRLMILEGVGSARKELRDRLAYSIWIETPPIVCLQRGISRDGVEQTSLWMDWQAREAAFFESDPVRSHVHLIVDGQGGLQFEADH
jgi:hypothetical protein